MLYKVIHISIILIAHAKETTLYLYKGLLSNLSTTYDYLSIDNSRNYYIL